MAQRENGSLTDAMTRCEAAEGELGRGHVIVMADIISSGKKLAALGNLWGTLVRSPDSHAVFMLTLGRRIAS